MTHTLKPVSDETLNEQQIADYLREHPEFFENHNELLESLTLPAPDHGVVSLTMRQLGLLRERNEKLQDQLENLLNIARDNDGLFGRMQNLTLALMDARSVEDLFATLDSMLRECFSADCFAIRILGEDSASFPISEVYIAQDSPEAKPFAKIISSNKVKCGHPTHAQAESLFGDSAGQAQSSAIIPFRVAGKTAILAIGSSDSNRFHPSMGNLFLVHLGELVGRRLDGLLAAESQQP